MDPRTKLGLGGMSIAAAAVMQRPAGIVAAFMLVLVVLPVTGLLRTWWRALRLMGPVTLLVLGIGIFSFGWETGVLLSLRLMTLLTLSLVFFHMLPPAELGDGLRKLRVPYGATFILTAGMRYVPLVGLRIRRIVDAQRSRGIDMRFRLRNLSHFMALLMPLLVQSFVLSEELACAMEARGFSRKGRSMRREYHMAVWEYGLLILAAGLFAALLWWELAG